MPTLQERLNARGTVVIDGEQVIHQPLIIRARTNLIGGLYGGLRTTYNGPAIMTAIDESVTNFSIRSLFLTGGGIEFPGGAGPEMWPSFFEIDDLFISGASIAFNDSYSGAWMGKVSRVFAANCHAGFRVFGGTTKTFDTCHVAAGTDRAWELFAVYNSRLVNCAADVTDLPMPAADFRSCRGLTVDSFYFELNTKGGGPLLLFDSCDALTVRNMYSLRNKLVAPAGGGSYLMQVHSCIGVLDGVSLGGGIRATPDVASGHATGHTATLLLTGENHLALNACHIAPAKKTVLSQTVFSFKDNSGGVSTVATTACKIDPSLAPGQP